MSIAFPRFPKIALLGAVSSLSILTSCGVSTPQTFSTVQTVDLSHTKAKWQSIGNCWAYAFVSWAESMVLSGTLGTVDLSESYITMRYYQSQLLQGPQKELEAGGSFERAARLTLKFGYMFEGDFLPSESIETFSKIQKSATAYLNTSILSGALSKSRNLDIINAEIESAFGFKFDTIAPKIKRASDLAVALNPDGSSANDLAASIQSWTEAQWPKDLTTSNQPLPHWNYKFTNPQQAVLYRVKQALNDGHPVVMDWFVDFNALDQSGEFDGSLLKSLGTGRQGYHSVVIEDYTVEGIDPKTGQKFIVGEGDVSPELKALALNYGQIKSFIIKNSWGGLERIDRASYVRGSEGGYHKLNADYIFAWLKQADEKTGAYQGKDTALSRFVLPPGY